MKIIKTTNITLKKLSKTRIYIIITFIFVSLYIVYSYFQNPISYNEGKGWDGQSYYKVAKQFINNENIVGDSPFVNRIATPYLVSILVKFKIIGVNDILKGFLIINLLATYVSVLLLHHWLEVNNIEETINIFVLLIYLTNWIGPLRGIIFYPATVDPLFIVFLLLGLILLKLYKKQNKRNYIYILSIISFGGILIRESFIIFPISFLFVDITMQNHLVLKRLKEKCNIKIKDLIHKIIMILKSKWILFIPLLSSIIAIVALKNLVTISNNYSLLTTIYHFLTNKSIILSVAGIFISYGQIIIILFIFKKYVRYLLIRELWQSVFLITIFVVAFVGGSDTERFLYWGFPLLFLLYAKSIEKYKVIFYNKLLFLIITVTQIISGRIFLNTPDYPNDYSSIIPFLSYFANRFPYLDLYSYHGNPKMILIILVQYIILTFFIYIIISKIRFNRVAKRFS